MDYLNIENKKYLVTGATSGIGLSICEKISLFKGKVIAIGRDESKLVNALKRMHFEGHSYITADLNEINDINDIIDSISEIDGIIHSAGYQKLLSYRFIKKTEINDMFSINYYAPILLTQGLLSKSKIKNNSSIIFITSISSMISTVGNIIYSGSKGALTSSARALSLEVASKNIRVNCIAPGLVRTPLFAKLESSVSKEQIHKEEANYPLGFGDPSDVANLALFLLSDASKWITGSNIVIDGGFSIK